MNDKPSVDPPEHRAGRVRFDLSLGPIARMFPAPDQQASENTGGGAVFAGRAGEVLENVAREHYGHNITLPAGRYRVTVRIAPHPLVADDPITGDFTVAVG